MYLSVCVVYSQHVLQVQYVLVCLCGSQHVLQVQFVLVCLCSRILSLSVSLWFSQT